MENQNQVTVTKSQELQLMQQQADAQFAMTPAGQMVRTFETTQRIGGMFAKSTIVPKAYQGNVANCAIAVDVAMHLGGGVSPLTVMQNLVIVNGTPTWHAPFLVACINASEKYTPIDYEEKNLGKIGKGAKVKVYVYENGKSTEKTITTDEYADVDNLACTAFAYNLASGNKLTGSTITVKMAMEEGWYARSGSKWKTMPQQMLKYRAASFWQRAYEPGIAMGFQTTEEVHDTMPEGATVVDVTDEPAKTPAEKAMERAMAKKAAQAEKTAETEQSPAEAEKAAQYEPQEGKEGLFAGNANYGTTDPASTTAQPTAKEGRSLV